jgi:hypothetical protein
MGRLDEAITIVDELERRRDAEFVDAYFMAVCREALGQREAAFSELERACAENSAWLYSIDIDPKMDSFKGDPRFARLRATLGP